MNRNKSLWEDKITLPKKVEELKTTQNTIIENSEEFNTNIIQDINDINDELNKKADKTSVDNLALSLTNKLNTNFTNADINTNNVDKFLKVNSLGKIDFDIPTTDLSDYYNKEEVDGLTSINHDIDSITVYVNSESVGSTATSVLKVYQKKSGHLLLEDEKEFIGAGSSPGSEIGNNWYSKFIIN